MNAIDFDRAEAILHTMEEKQVSAAVYEKYGDDLRDSLDCVRASMSGVLTEVERDAGMTYRMYLRSPAWEIVVCDVQRCHEMPFGVVFVSDDVIVHVLSEAQTPE